MPDSRHGFVRGASLPRESRLFEGRFGRMFRSLAPMELDPEDPAVKKLLHNMARPKPLMGDPNAKPGDKEGIMASPEPLGPTAETAVDKEENLNIPAGYTYLGQFIDHDLTLDPASSMQRKNDPEALVNFRTPRFDLDSVYGRGPSDQPYMYEAAPHRGEQRYFLLGDKIGTPTLAHADPNAVDHLRAPANAVGVRRALTGDKRNDENTIVAQMHTIFLRFHNRFAARHLSLTFAEVQQQVRWHYQYVVLHDYLRRIVGREMVHSILPHLAVPDGDIFELTPKLRHYSFENDPFLPTEFSTAAFRFGHSMVRPVYRLSRDFSMVQEDKINDQNDPNTARRMIFAPKPRAGLNGFAAIPAKWAIEWQLFFGDCTAADTKYTPDRVQPAYKIDTSLVNPLATLPEFAGSASDEMNLAYRNILRGLSMRLPCGEDVARAMGVEPLKRPALRIGKAEDQAGWDANPFIDSFELPGGIRPFVGKTPLWLYILCEGAQNALAGKNHALGPVGGRIVAETFIGILLGDKQSYLHQDPRWKPEVGMGGTAFDMLKFIEYAQG